MGLISLAPTPWWVLPIEFFIHGPSFALCVTAIVSYASVVAPSGTSTIVQGLVQSMNDGVGKVSNAITIITILFNKNKYK
jgi:hypothetical protein